MIDEKRSEGSKHAIRVYSIILKKNGFTFALAAKQIPHVKQRGDSAASRVSGEQNVLHIPLLDTIVDMLRYNLF